MSFGLRSPPWLHCIINGSGLFKTNFFSPLAIRSIVFGASGRTARIPYFLLISSAVSNMLGQGREKSNCVYAPTYGFNSPAFTSSLSAGPCVGSGQTIGLPSHRATIKNRFRMVGAP